MKDYNELFKEAIDKLPKDVKLDIRLEIPKPQTSITGNQTAIANFIEIANVIRRDPQHLLKFLSKELAAPAHIENTRAIFQGKIYNTLIEKKLETYYKDFLYCTECHKPDTHIIKQDRISFLKCDACGAKHPVKMLN